MAEQLEARARGLALAAELTYEQLAEAYLAEAEARLGPEAYDRAVEHLERFGGWPGPADPSRIELRVASAITRGDAERFRDAMIEAGCSASYVADGLLKTVKACFRWACAVEPGRHPGLPLPSNPMLGLKGPAVPRRAARRIDPVAVSRFLRWAWRRALAMGEGPNGRHARAAVVLLLTLRDTGARPKDLWVAEWDEWSVLPDGWGLLRLPAWKWKNGPKTGEDRLIAVPPHCTRRIEALRALEGRHPTRIFTHRRGRGRAAAGEGTALAGEPWVRLDPRGSGRGTPRRCRSGSTACGRGGRRRATRCRRGSGSTSTGATTRRRRGGRGVNDVALAKALGTSVRMLDRHYTDQDEADVLGVARAATRRPGPG